MCGIAGAFAIDGRSVPPLDQTVLQRMTDIIRHRGPDDDGYAQGAGMSLGARRLSIIDVKDGHQPLCDERGRHLVGEVAHVVAQHIEVIGRRLEAVRRLCSGGSDGEPRDAAAEHGEHHHEQPPVAHRP